MNMNTHMELSSASSSYKAGQQSSSSVNHERASSQTPALFDAMGGNVAETSLNMDTEALEGQEYDDLEFSKFTSRLQKSDYSSVQTYRVDMATEPSQY